MLIIAIPKSASSSLITLLSKQHNLPDRTKWYRRLLFRFLVRTDAYRQMCRMHSGEVANYPKLVLETLCNDTSIVKYHIPPTEHNQALLKETKKVILLRKDSDAIIDSYQRGDETGVYTLKSIFFFGCFSREQWHTRAKKNGLINELDSFRKGWEQHDGDACIVYYEDVVKRPLETLQKIEAYYTMPISQSTPQLPERRFSRTKQRRYVSRKKRIRHHLWVLYRGVGYIVVDMFGLWDMYYFLRDRKKLRKEVTDA